MVKKEKIWKERDRLPIAVEEGSSIQEKETDSEIQLSHVAAASSQLTAEQRRPPVCATDSSTGHRTPAPPAHTLDKAHSKEQENASVDDLPEDARPFGVERGRSWLPSCCSGERSVERMRSLVPLTHSREPADSLCRVIHARVDLSIMHLLNVRRCGLQGIAAEAAPHHCCRDGRSAHLQQERKHCWR